MMCIPVARLEIVVSAVLVLSCRDIQTRMSDLLPRLSSPWVIITIVLFLLLSTQSMVTSASMTTEHTRTFFHRFISYEFCDDLVFDVACVIIQVGSWPGALVRQWLLYCRMTSCGDRRNDERWRRLITRVNCVITWRYMKTTAHTGTMLLYIQYTMFFCCHTLCPQFRALAST